MPSQQLQPPPRHARLPCCRLAPLLALPSPLVLPLLPQLQLVAPLVLVLELLALALAPQVLVVPQMSRYVLRVFFVRVRACLSHDAWR